MIITSIKLQQIVGKGALQCFGLHDCGDPRNWHCGVYGYLFVKATPCQSYKCTAINRFPFLLSLELSTRVAKAKIWYNEILSEIQRLEN